MLPASYTAGVVLLAVIPLAFLIARHVSKHSKRLPWSVDDILLWLALFMLYLVVGAFFVVIIVGHARPQMKWAKKKQVIPMIAWLFKIPMALSLTLCRCAITIFFLKTLYTKLFPCLRRLAYLCIAFAIAQGLVYSFGTLFRCWPIEYNWTTTKLFKSGRCFSSKKFFIAVVALGVIADALIWTLPHCVVWRLKLRTAHKLAITAIFAFGLLTIMVGALRIASLAETTYSRDVVHSTSTMMLWTMGQCSTAIVVACLPHLRPVLEKCIPRRMTSRSRSPSTLQGQQRSNERRPYLVRGRQSSITVTTRIDVSDEAPTPTVAPSNDGQHGPWEPQGPVFKIEPGPAAEIEHRRCCLVA